MTSQDQRLRGPARALLVIEQAVLADIVKLALKHGQYNTTVCERPKKPHRGWLTGSPISLFSTWILLGAAFWKAWRTRHEEPDVCPSSR